MKKYFTIIVCLQSIFCIAQAPYPAAPAAPGNITGIEYFIDSSPDFGSGTPITGFTSSTNVSNFSTSVSLAGISPGFHHIYFRCKDADGKWSLTNNVFFDNFNLPVYPSASSATNIVQLEYFIDNNDLGFGNCTPIAVTPNTNIANLSANINITGLIQSTHRLFIRSKDATGKWSLTNFSVFDNSALQAYPLAPAAPPAISNMEYFIDADPGFGNGTPLTVPGNTGGINNYAVSLDLSGSLSVGTHYLYIRSKQNPWSLTNIVPFNATVPLPVNWLFVKAQIVNRQTNISWATVQEINTAKYEVEQSIDARIFTKIGEVAAAGNSSTSITYNFTHYNPVTGFNYYRIKQIDRDGNFKYSMTVVVLKKEGLFQTIIAPNPVKDIINVVEPAAIFITSAEVYSINGILLLHKEINDHIQAFGLPVNSLASGSYLLKINYKNDSKVCRFIKQ